MNQDRILRMAEVINRSGLSRPTIYRQISKGIFPTAKKLTGKEGRAVGWLESEVEAWISNRE
ncbi:helix-turn-helix transcriptional regulator [Cedecea davisae]|uniref:helix-turn-helix transcriptional regulator n=1 Tax=Cedecea davisae TaxID=158484 RepID=UPI00242C61B3|nr:AlpA family phage regulatory protein [Cedecea davisae]